MGFTVFILSIVVSIIVVVIVLFIILRFFSFKASKRDINIYNTIVAVLALVFGTAATIGGAVATIKIANTALSISNNQDSRDTKKFLEERIAHAEELFSNISVSISEVSVSGIMLKTSLSEYTQVNPEIKKYLSNPLPEDIKKKVEIFRESLKELRKNLIALQKDTFTFRMYKNVLPYKKSYLAFIGKKLEEHGFTKLESHVSHTNIIGLAHFIRIAEDRLTANKFHILLIPILSTNLADSPTVGKNYDNISLRALIFTGNLIHNLTTESKKNKNVLISVSYGTAMLADLAYSMPHSDSIRNELKKTYPELKEYIEQARIDFNPKLLLGPELTYPLNELEKRTDLLFLETK